MSNIVPVVMAGGNGTRLWPLSRSQYPKQFLALGQELTLLQQVFERLNGIEISHPLILCNEEHRFLAAEQLRALGELDHNIILEPEGRNTAPAVALAALHAIQKNPEAILLVLASDHLITNRSVFQNAIRKAVPVAEQGHLVTFGIVPTHPETGYGYIKQGNQLSEVGVHGVAQFVEKPELDTAKSYVESGNYLWNSGIFVFKASRYLEELKAQRPDIYEACQNAVDGINYDMDFIRINADAFAQCPSESIDYAVMEKTESATVVSLDAGWSDIGSWSALWEVSEQDVNGNAVVGDVVAQGTSNSYIYAESSLVATLGLDNIVVVQTKDAVLVTDKSSTQNIKNIVNELNNNKRLETQVHRDVYRPWGKYETVDSGTRHQVKRITVKPGEKLSVQMHHHRSEHWIVVSGTANVTIDNKSQLVTENESVYIPVGSVHALENPGKIPLELIEVQSGPYLGEDDIVRFEDRYGRDVKEG